MPLDKLAALVVGIGIHDPQQLGRFAEGGKRTGQLQGPDGHLPSPPPGWEPLMARLGTDETANAVEAVPPAAGELGAGPPEKRQIESSQLENHPFENLALGTRASGEEKARQSEQSERQ